MAGYNRVVLLGNLCRDPELRNTSGGASVVELRLAVNEIYRNRTTNERVEKTCFVDVVVWHQQAEACSQYLSKGSPILVEGRLQYDEWKTAQGESRNKLRVQADRVQFIGSPPRGGSQDGGGYGQSREDAAVGASVDDALSREDDSLPRVDDTFDEDAPAPF
jgi:single-strand DNA-binding protein